MRAKEFTIENDDEDDAFYPMPLKLGDYRDPYNPRDHEPYDAKFKDNQSLRDMVEDLIDAGVEPAVVMISPRQLTATQDWLANARYRDSDPLFDDYDDRPVVLNYQGHFYILDGHHRSSSAFRANQILNVYMFTAPQGVEENFVGTLREFAPNADFNRRGMEWEDFLKLVTPAMLKWGFDVDYKNTEIMYSRNGRGEDEVYFIVLDPQDDMVHYSFGSQEAGEPAIHEQNFVSMDQHGAKVFLQRADEGYLLSNLKKDVEENFADGKRPQDKGDSVRHGIPKKATMAELERASHAKGRKGQLARWQLNMRRGRKK
jgi:hypothetical protein